MLHAVETLPLCSAHLPYSIHSVTCNLAMGAVITDSACMQERQTCFGIDIWYSFDIDIWYRIV